MFGDKPLDKTLMDVMFGIDQCRKTLHRFDFKCGNCWVEPNVITGKVEVVLHKDCRLHQEVIEETDKREARKNFRLN